MYAVKIGIIDNGAEIDQIFILSRYHIVVLLHEGKKLGDERTVNHIPCIAMFLVELII